MTTFTTTRNIAVDPAAIFAAIADPKRLALWWGPDGFTNTFETFEFRQGGLWKFSMHGPDGRIYPNESQFVTVVPNSKVIVQHLSAPHFELSITLLAQPEGTTVLWEQRFDDPAVAASVRHIVEPANEQNLDRLTAEVLPPRLGDGSVDNGVQPCPSTTTH